MEIEGSKEDYVDLLKCEKCSLRKDAKQVVPPEGKQNSKIVIVGRNPGEKEDEAGRPFVGPGGKFLNKMLEALDLYKREDIYITNMCKCFSKDNRPPTDEETKVCTGWLLGEIKKIKPLIIMPLGNQAATVFMGEKYGRVVPYHGQIFYHSGVNSFIIPLYHPGFSVRNPKYAQECLADMDMLRKKIPLLFMFLQETGRGKLSRMFSCHAEFIQLFEPFVVEKESHG